MRKREWKVKFLAALRTSGNVRLACDEAGVDRSWAYKQQKRSLEFAEQWAEALQEAIDRLEAEAWKRARDGVTRHKPIFYRGDKVGEEIITEYSDTLMVLLLKSHRPNVYRERQENINTNIRPNQITIIEAVKHCQPDQENRYQEAPT